MAHRHGNFIRDTDRKALFFGFSNLHVEMRTFDWGNIGCGVSSWSSKTFIFLLENIRLMKFLYFLKRNKELETPQQYYYSVQDCYVQRL